MATERTAHEEVRYSCCDLDFPGLPVDVQRCLLLEEVKWYAPFLKFLIIFLTIPMGAALLVKIFNMYMGTLERNFKMDSVHIHILNTLRLETIEYFYVQGSSTRACWKHAYYCFFYLILWLALTAFGYAALVMQIYPSAFMIVPEIYGVAIPPSITAATVPAGILHLFATIIIIITHLKQLICLHQPERQDRSRLLPQDRYLAPMSAGRTNLQFKNMITDLTKNLLSLKIVVFFNNLIQVLVYLPFFLTKSSTVIPIVIFLTEVLTLRLKYHLLPINSKLKVLNCILAPVLFLIAFCYSVITVFQFWIIFQAFFRIIITVTTFIITYSVYFSVAIVVIIPYLYVVIAYLDDYTEKLHSLPLLIMKLDSAVEQEVDKILNAENGKLIIDFLVGSNNAIEVDVPEMLKGTVIEITIQNYIRRLVEDHRFEINVGMSQMVLNYRRDGNTIIEVTLPENENYPILCANSEGKDNLLTEISAHLQNTSIDTHRERLVKTFYDITRINSARYSGIPLELFHYLRYYAPTVSLNLWSVVVNFLIITGLFLTFLLTLLLHSHSWSFTSLTTAAANTPILFIGTTLTLRYFKIPLATEKETSEILLANLIHYRRGYRLFCTRGLEYKPLSKLVKIALTGKNI
ncbi:uncharacterized protein TRIADDRAFT_55306 [Trichoplax adhaerens]|uniref:Uncharacterized protein n=1 Tax=Trichoplax adhaerens TaxID=10228 RepID=B3RUI9_TRIAD|nr:predicted protein [Trichoplax adhaerens]EDV25823.1 predicted protein [Trichoplax adhaerens]|eukprot:XP_002111856.1 predicted protein [Trichoplax adhaerens]